MGVLQNAEKAWKALSGVVCLYKPAGLHATVVQNTVLANLCRDLNNLRQRPLERMVEISGDTNAPMNVSVIKNLADHPLVVGERYQMEDFKSSYATHLGRHTSGVFLMGINEGTRLTFKIHNNRPTRAFKIHGKLGKATDTYFTNGKIVEKATYKHVTKEKIDRVVSYMQAIHQKKMYDLCGVDIASQAGYELAAMGPIRPANGKLPVLYGIKCVHFESPDFIIEVQSINEYEHYLYTLIHDIGMQLKTVAHCTALQCIRHGKFTVEHALLRKHWDVKTIIESIKTTGYILNNHRELLKAQSAALA